MSICVKPNLIKSRDWQKLSIFGQFLYFTPIDFILQKRYIYTITAHVTTYLNILLQKKVNETILCKRRNDMIMVEESKKKIGLERYITRIMLDLGVPAHLKGYHYIREAILLSEQDMEVVSSVTKLLYPEIARSYKTTSQKVERAIRNAIEVSWNRGNTDTMEELFGYSSAGGKNRPTNSEYIARIADKIRLDLRTQILAS